MKSLRMDIKYNDRRVFISYARADSEVANRLYDDLKLSGMDPWLDTESLLGGQDWKFAIKEAIRSSRYFIPLLSSNSVEKVGYVQREFKEALEFLKEFPPSKIFVIPVRFDDVKIDDNSLNRLHIIDLFPDWEQGIQKIQMAMGIEVSNSADIGQKELTYQYDEETELLRFIYERICVPFVGPEAHDRWIPTNRSIAMKWAEEHSYPFQDTYELPQVAQYLAITKNDETYPKKYLSKILKSIFPTPDFSAPEYQNTVYAVLADLNLPIYVTTNYDHLLEEALRSRGKDPRSEFCRWNKTILDYARRAEIPVISDDHAYTASSATPLVFHLHGDMGHPLSMVLTEQDYLEFMLNMSNLDRNPAMLPSLIRKSFATSSLLFIGFTINDTNSRILFRSIFEVLTTVEPLYSLAVMPPPYATTNSGDPVQAKNYLAEFARNMFKLNIRWSDQFIFSVELRNSFNKFKRGISTPK